LEFTGPVTALIETTTKGEPHHERVHIEKLKKYFPRDETPVEVELPYSEDPVDAVNDEPQLHPPAHSQVTKLPHPSEVPLAPEPDSHVNSEAAERLTRAPISSAEISHGTPTFPNLTDNESAGDSPVIDLVAHDSLRNESATSNNLKPIASHAPLTVLTL